MKSSKLLFYSFIHSLGVLVYVTAVAWIMSNGERFFGAMSGFWGPTALLMLLVLSAAVAGLLIFGRPVLMYLNGLKSEAIKLLLFTIGWLVVITIVVFLSLMIIK